MNSILRLFFVAFIVVGISSQAFSQAYKINVKVRGVSDTACYLAYHFGDKQYLKDTAVADSKGSFTFTGKEALPGGIYLVVLPGKKYFEIIVNEQNFSLETDTLDYVKHMKVKGSVENTLFFNYLNFLGPKGTALDSLQKSFATAKDKKDSTNIREKIESLNKEVMDYRSNVVKSNPGTFVSMLFKAMTVPEPTKEEEDAAKAKGDSAYQVFKYHFYKNHFFDNIDFNDDRITRTPIYHQKLKEFISNLTVPNVDSISKAADWLIAKAKNNKELFKYTVWYITTTHETSNLMGADAVYVHMVDKYYKTKQAYWVDTATLKKIIDRSDLLKPLLIGKKAPALILADSNKKYIALHNLTGKYTIVYFWDPNCGHCQKETPKLYDIYKKYKDQGVQAYAVNIDRDRKKWIEYINKHDLRWINVYDPDYRVSFKQLYDIYSTPVIYLLNEKKEIIAKRIGVEQVDEILGNMIKADKEKKAKGK